MSLRRKAFLILLGIYLLYALLDSTIFHLIIYPSFDELQITRTRHVVEDCLRAIDSERDALGRCAASYATSDDARAFVAELNPEYVDSHFTDAMFEQNRVSFAGIFAVTGAARVVRGYDLTRHTPTNYAALTTDALGAVPRLLALADTNDATDGFYHADTNTFLLVCRPVRAGNNRGPVRGALVMARLVDASFAADLSTQIGQDISFLPGDATWPPNQKLLPVVPGTSQTDVWAKQVSTTELECRSVLLDIDGNPVLHLRMRLPRTIAERSEQIGFVATVSSLAGGLLFILAALILLETTVLSRVHALGQAVSRIATTQDLSTRLPLRGDDELSRLTGGINLMLAALQQSETRLKLSEERYRTLFESANDAIFLLRDNRFTDCNPQALTLLGAERTDIIGSPLERFLPERQPSGAGSSELIVDRLRRATAGMAQFFEWQFTRLDGQVFDAEVHIDRVGLRDSSYVLVVVRNVTESRQAEHRYRLLFREMLDGFALHEIVCDANGKPCDYRFLEVNPAFEKQTGLKADEIIGKLAKVLIPTLEPYWVETYGEVALTGNPVHFQHYAEPLGRNFEVAAFSPVRGQFATIFRDVTERERAEEEQRRLEAKFLQAQKLESLGVLAGGIAHDFNNLLVGILGNADLAVDDLPEGSTARATIGSISDAAKRAAELCRQMLAYSGKGRLAIGPIDISKLVEDMARLLEISVAKNVLLRFNLAQNVPFVEADSAQVRQIVMSLVTNASEAIGTKSGIISVTTGSMVCGMEYLSGAFVDDGLRPGTYAFIDVADTGCGMDAETVNQVFDPFFTTKFIGRGLGLASVLGIVRGHKGAIRVQSALRKGSTFRVLFPVVDHTAPPSHSQPVGASDVVKGGTILLADDDETVRAVGKRMLEKIGFRVLLAEHGRDALHVFREHEEEIVCVILDLTMPHMGGEEALRKVKALNRDMPIIISSGYDEEDVVTRFSHGELSSFVQKPYQASEMMEAIRRAMG